METTWGLGDYIKTIGDHWSQLGEYLETTWGLLGDFLETTCTSSTTYHSLYHPLYQTDRQMQQTNKCKKQTNATKKQKDKYQIWMKNGKLEDPRLAGKLAEI